MTPTTFAAIRKRAGLTQPGLASLLRLRSDRSIRMMESGERAISGPVSILMELIDADELPDRYRL